MRTHVMPLWIVAVWLLVASLELRAQRPPPTRTGAVVDTLHGRVIPDPYRWLEDQEGQETRRWIEAQNAYTESVLGRGPGREVIRNRLAELMKVDVVGTPMLADGRYFFSRRLKDQELSVIYMREGHDGDDQVLIDPHPWSADHSTRAGLVSVSHDGELLIYAVREGGAGETEVRFFDVDERQDLPDRLERARYFGVVLAPDKKGVFYSKFSNIGARVYYRALGGDPADDEMIFGEGYGPDKLIAVDVSDDGRYLGIIVFHGSAAQKTEFYVKDLGEGGPIETVVNDIDAGFFPTFAGDNVILQTDWNAPNGRVLRVALDRPEREYWLEIIPEREGVIQRISEVFTSGVAAVGKRLFVSYLDRVMSRVEIYDINGNSEGAISFPAIGSVREIVGPWDGDEAFVPFSSFHISTTIYRYNVSAGTRSVWAKLDVPVATEDVEVKQVWYKSKDGTRVPMFLVHRRDLTLDGTNPTMLTGYGGFGASLTPAFSATAMFAVENGFVYAVANLRGGGEFGEEWHRAGMLENKQNVFDDFIAAAEWLVGNGYTNPSKLAIVGGSNGGLLVGAAMTQRPDLYRAVICTYPLLDMLRYHKFLMGRFWISEYGSADDPDQFQYLYEYSPYHKVSPGTEYPAVLFITGDADTRSAPLHARKMTASVQAATASDRPVLLKYDTKSGHMGGRPLSELIDEWTDVYSFLLSQLEMGGNEGR